MNRTAVFGVFLLLAGALSGCISLSFNRKVSTEENVLRVEVRSYYDEMAAAFAAGNAEALAMLYDSSIAEPMTQAEIRAWARDFFKEHGPASFNVTGFSFESIGTESAVVKLTYRVVTRDGKGSFGATERDRLVKRDHRRWAVTSWKKLGAN